MLRTLPPLLLILMMLSVLSALPAKLHNAQAHNRTSRDKECYEDEYWHKGKCCITCPAGTYVFAPCTENHARGMCKDCAPGEYFTAGPNGLEQCEPCLICTDDKVLVQACTPKSNAVCECKPGYYCSPDEPCEMCNRCSRCGDGQRIKKPCTSTTDTVCENINTPISTSTKANVKDGQTVPVPVDSSKNITGDKAAPKSEDFTNYVPEPRTEPTKPPDDPAGSYLYITLPVVFSLLLLAIIFGIFLYKRKTKDKNEAWGRRVTAICFPHNQNSLIPDTLNNSAHSSLYFVQSEGKDPKEEEVPPEQQRLMPPEHRNVEIGNTQQAVPAVPIAQSEPNEGNGLECQCMDDVEDEENSQLGKICKECNLPQPCDQQWDIFFYAVTDNVAPERILELVRKLHLHRAAQTHTIRDNPNNCKEQNYTLLSQWRIQKGTQASMKAVLKELMDMDLAGCCENIVNTLRSKNIPIN
ncbi:tumor necrosis factor receptor superfamily member 1A-like [Leptodactylus fuscus]|uniref:tumor necrosis factor receptor superfamily member 1A-like n=1 Tax=Leptodactylus fuscus TaxID=238119 RepID=UPI003F4EF212